MYTKIDKERYFKNRQEILKKRKYFYKLHPEHKLFNQIKQRCENSNFKEYKYYGAKGIKLLLTKEEIRWLMERDNYWTMKKPSIDRLNSNGHYELSNCRFVEISVNVAERNKRMSSKPILQFDKQGNFIKEWKSITNAANELQIFATSITANAKQKKFKSAGGYIWRYK